MPEQVRRHGRQGAFVRAGTPVAPGSLSALLSATLINNMRVIEQTASNIIIDMTATTRLEAIDRRFSRQVPANSAVTIAAP